MNSNFKFNSLKLQKSKLKLIYFHHQCQVNNKTTKYKFNTVHFTKCTNKLLN